MMDSAHSGFEPLFRRAIFTDASAAWGREKEAAS
jgi:hypothetical protein